MQVKISLHKAKQQTSTLTTINICMGFGLFKVFQISRVCIWRWECVDEIDTIEIRHLYEVKQFRINLRLIFRVCFGIQQTVNGWYKLKKCIVMVTKISHQPYSVRKQ